MTLPPSVDGARSNAHPKVSHADYSAPALIALANAGHHAELENQTLKLIAQHPEDGLLWKILSVALWKQGKDPVDALEHAAQLLPNDAEAHTNLGNGLRARQLLDRAAQSHRRALALRPDYAEAHNNLGTVLRMLGQLNDAVTSFRRAVVLNAGFTMAHFNLGDTLFHLRHFHDSLVSFRQVIMLQPDHALAYNGEGTALLSLGYYADALCSFQRAVSLKPDFAEAHNNMGVALRQQGDMSGALNACQRALQINPRSVAAITFLAQLQADQGDFAAAQSHLEHSLSIEPDLPEAWAFLATLRRMTGADAGWLTQVRRLLAKPLTPRQEIVLRFAVGKYLDDTRDFDAAFAAYQQANELTKCHGLRYEGDVLMRSTDHLIRCYDRAWLERVRNDSNCNARPIFIVGMPRSGTTLVEQILASHSAVFGAGELPFWTDAAYAQAASLESLVDGANTARELADTYLVTLDRRCPAALKVTDKMPENFRHLGLIHAALPRARIIHVQRNPLDTCLSIYFQDFQTTHAYAADLEHIAQVYGDYQRVMRHWREMLSPDAMLEIDYEDLVRDPECWIRRVLTFAGLDWDPACLNPHLTSRPISTFSKWQARQRINASSIERWRHYARYCGPLSGLTMIRRHD